MIPGKVSNPAAGSGGAGMVARGRPSRRRVPGTYGECFALLGEAGIISDELSGKLQRMTRFGNMLVHVYWEIDYDQALQRDLV